jgi:tol-pal system protein YbgF
MRHSRSFGIILVYLIGFAIFAPAFAQDAAEFQLRLDRLEAENRRLTGQLDEMRFALRRLEDQFKRFQTDADSRFRDLETNRRPPAPAPAPTTPRRSDAFDPDPVPGAAGAPRPLSPSTSLPAGALPPGARLAPENPPGAPLDVATPRRPPGVSEPAPSIGTGPKAEFDQARALIERGDNELAEGAFRDFVQTYPKDRLVPEATFWLGESFLRRTRYREAAEQYLIVTSKFPSAARAPEAMVKLGVSLRGLGAKPEACETFNQVGKKFPNASAEIKQSAQRERVRAAC